MAKLIFRYGAMNSGKTTVMLQTAFNYEERGHKVILIKPACDTKGGDKVVSRIGIERCVDELIYADDKIMDKVRDYLSSISCIIVDEGQFLQSKQVDELYYISKLYDIPVIVYGLRTDFLNNSFTGSPRLLEISDQIEELPTICRCGKKARLNARLINGEFVTSGRSILIDGDQSNITYESLCGVCYLKKVVGARKNNIDKIIYKKNKDDNL